MTIQNGYSTISLLLLLLATKIAKTNLTWGNCGKPTIEPVIKSTNEASRIVHGSEATAHSLPWMVMIGTNAGGSFIECAGFLIENGETNQTDLVMTAAHCLVKDLNFLPASKITVVIGAHVFQRGQPLQPVRVRTYVTPFYNARAVLNDMALLKLDKKIEYSYKAMPICLPKKQSTLELPKTDICFAAGWGTGENGQMSRVLKVTQFIPAKEGSHNNYIHQKTVLRVEKLNLNSSLGMGDSGGPLSCKIDGRFVAVGILSLMGINWITDEYEPKYVRIDAYIDWIRDKTKELSSAEKDLAESIKLKDFFPTINGLIYIRPPKAKPIEILAHNLGFKSRDK